MKIRKHIIVLFCLLVLLSGCSSGDIKDIPGDYYPISCSDEDGNEYELEDERLHLDEGGTGYFFFQDNMYELLWKYEDGVFYFEDSSGDVFEGIFNNGKISGKYFFDYFYEFRKEKNK